MLCCVVLCCVMLCYAMWCDVMLWMYVRTYVRLYVCVYIYVYVYICMYIYIYIYIWYICIYIYVYTQIYTYIIIYKWYIHTYWKYQLLTSDIISHHRTQTESCPVGNPFENRRLWTCLAYDCIMVSQFVRSHLKR